MNPSQRGCGVIRHDQTEVLSPNASVGVVYRGERLQCHSVKIQKSSGRESHLEGGLIRGKTVRSKDCRLKAEGRCLKIRTFQPSALKPPHQSRFSRKSRESRANNEIRFTGVGWFVTEGGEGD
jgi:hypothetical protein